LRIPNQSRIGGCGLLCATVRCDLTVLIVRSMTEIQTRAEVVEILRMGGWQSASWFSSGGQWPTDRTTAAGRGLGAKTSRPRVRDTAQSMGQTERAEQRNLFVPARRRAAVGKPNEEVQYS